MTTVADTSVLLTSETHTITVPLTALLEHLPILGLAVAKRPHTPVLGGVRLDTGPEGTFASTFDYGTSVRVQVDSAPRDVGTTLLSFTELDKICKAAVKGETRGAWAGWQVKLDARSSSGTRVEPGRYGEANQTVPWKHFEADIAVAGFTLPVGALDVTEFPALPTAPTPTFTVNRVHLLAALQKVAVAAGGDDTLPALTGIRLELDGSALTLVATDRFRLHQHAIQVEPAVDAPPKGGWLIPAKALLAVLKSLTGSCVAFHLPQDTGASGVAGLVCGDTSVTVRPLASEFPRWRQLLPAEVPVTIELDLAAFRKAVAKVKNLASAVDARYMSIDVGDNQVAVAPFVAEDGHRVKGMSLPAETSGEPIRIGFDFDYLLVALGTFTGDTVAMGMFDSAVSRRGAVIAPTVAELCATVAVYRVLLMPVRLGEVEKKISSYSKPAPRVVTEHAASGAL